VLIGGSGVDLADYHLRTAAVVLRPDNLANDGTGAEHDNIRSDVENLTGGAGADTLYGSAVANLLTGNAGNDTFYSAGDKVRDTLIGGTGTDRAHRDSIDAVNSVEAFF
jgi:Ca2+-binding RTX toxin-like protein